MSDVTATTRVRIVEVFADVSCPFTHVGLRRLIERREQLRRDDVVLRVRAWPLEFVNGAPLTGDFVGEEIDVLREVVAPDLFKGFDATRFPHSTIPALALAAAAYGRSDRIGEAASLELRNTVFEDGRDVGDPSWEIVAPVVSAPASVHPYAAGTWGPTAAHELIAPGVWHTQPSDVV